jgi:hypothetical protein
MLTFEASQRTHEPVKAVFLCHGYGKLLAPMEKLLTERGCKKVFPFIFLADSQFNILTALRIEWCKARARAHRWQEECLLLQEEMRRVKAFFRWKADWWLAKANDVRCEDLAVAQGMIAYAHRQRLIREAMLSQCEEAWRFVDMYLKTGQGVPEGDVFLVECH